MEKFTKYLAAIDGSPEWSEVRPLTLRVGEAEPLHLTAKGTIKDGQIMRVEPVDPAAYSTMVERSS